MARVGLQKFKRKEKELNDWAYTYKEERRRDFAQSLFFLLSLTGL